MDGRFTPSRDEVFMLPSVILIKRTEIPAISSIEEGGKLHFLGDHRDFRRHPVLAQFMPENARLAMSWAYLAPGQVLEPHRHPIRSMIVVCAGSGRLLGEHDAPLEAGDAVLVGVGCSHGFEADDPMGLYVLSIQFEGRGLYEDTGRPLVQFAPEHTLQTLLAYNERRLEQMVDSKLFQLMASGALEDRGRRDRFLECLHAWSRHFQTVMFARQASCSDEKYHDAFLRHLRAEAGHDAMLAAARGSAEVRWDSIIESAAAWFISRMSSADNAEKTAIVHLVLETTGARFHEVACGHLAMLGAEEYFAAHREDDDAHTEWGIELLSDLGPAAYARLEVVVGQAWDVFTTMLDRMADIVLEVPVRSEADALWEASPPDARETRPAPAPSPEPQSVAEQ
jgi:quercetin dioxygenase-like cupin family protein